MGSWTRESNPIELATEVQARSSFRSIAELEVNPRFGFNYIYNINSIARVLHILIKHANDVIKLTGR